MSDRYMRARAVFEGELERLRTATSGRNNALNRAAFVLGHFLGPGALDSDEVRTTLMEVGLAVGLSRSEAAATIASGMTAGSRAPRYWSEFGCEPTVRVRTWPRDGSSNGGAVPSYAEGDQQNARSTRMAEVVQALWMSSRVAGATAAEIYLQEARGIREKVPATLRFHPKVWHSGAGRHLPAMLGAVVIYGHGMTGVTITYLRSNGCAKADVQPNRRMLGQVKGGGVWLSPTVDVGTLLVSEGVETALSVQAVTELPAVAALSAYFLPHLLLPARTRKVIVAADPDVVGEEWAQRAAARWSREGRHVTIALPRGYK